MQDGTGRKRVAIWAISGLILAVVATTAVYFTFLKSPPGPEAATAEAQAAGGDDQAAVAHASKDDKSSDETGEQKENKKAPVPVNVATITTGPVSSYITSTANLISESEVKVLAEAEGRVAVLKVEEGDRVSRGQILAELVRDDAEIALKKAELRETNARMAYERGVKALAENLLSREDFDKLTMENQISQQELAEARWKLEKTTIRSPFTGHVTQRVIQLGQHVRPGDDLFTVADFDPLIARIYLPEKDVYGLKEGRDVRITLKARETTSFEGRVRQISPVVDTATGTVKVTVEAKSPPPEVRPGAFVTIDIVRETRPKALLLPREAVVHELQDSFVFVVSGETATKRSVSIGLEEGDHVQALSGVEAGEQVIVAGQGGLKDGSPIKVISSTEASTYNRVADIPARS